MTELEQAQIDNPEGSICSYCGNPNDFADDCGWFFIHPDAQKGSYDSDGHYVSNPGQGGYVCESCYNGEPGRKHIAFYGLGER